MFAGEILMRPLLLLAVIAATLFNSNLVFADSEASAIKQQLDSIKKQYGQAIAGLDNNPEDYELPGFALGNEAGLGQQGLSVGHSELVMSANIDDKFFGKMTLAFVEHDAETETEIEEAFIQTLGLGNGFTLTAGRFLSEVGYLNQQHAHAWDFADAPLIYRGLFGDQLIDDGMQMTWLAPTELFLQLGTELLSGSRFPAAGRTNGIGAWTAFIDIGGDIGIEHSWQLGLSHWQVNNMAGRASGGHAHGGDA
ncbi:MAG: hypothetical protein COB51_12750, partial [Moraxellaceae bacterium]